MRPELLNYSKVFFSLKFILFYSKNGMLIAGSCSSDRASTVASKNGHIKRVTVAGVLLELSV